MKAFEDSLPAVMLAALVLLAGASVMALGERDAWVMLRIAALDASTGEPTPVRVKLTDQNGRATRLPDQAIGIMYGMWDHADGFAYQPDSSFYVDGYFELALAPGTYVLSLSKGNEFVEVHDTLEVSGELERVYRMERWVDTAARGWYSADDHIHIRRSPREDPLLIDWIAAEDIRVGNLLRMGDFWAQYYAQYAFGQEGVYREDGYMLVSGQEDPRTPEIGHAIGLGASSFVRFSEHYYLYDLVFDSLRARGGVGGYAHQAETFHAARGLTLDGLRGKVDVLELVQFCAPGGPLLTEHYYALLNLGIAITATAGSDFPWCGKPHDGTGRIPVHENARIGNARFYTYVEGPLTYEAWMEAVKAGHTFATTGPVVFLEVEGRKPGSVLAAEAGDSLQVRVTALGQARQIPLDSVEIVVHGKVIAALSWADDGQSRERIVLEHTLAVRHGLWIAARVAAGPMQVAHTTPVYVRVGGDGFHVHDPGLLESLLAQSERALSDLEAVVEHRPEEVEYQAWRYREGLMERIEATRRLIDRMRAREGHSPPR